MTFSSVSLRSASGDALGAAARFTLVLDSQSNGLTVLIDRMKDQDLFAHVNLVKGERSHLAELASTLL